MASTSTENGNAQVYTYHCLCSQLLLAGASALDNHKQRAGESLDKAFIVPVMPAEIISSTASDKEGDDNANIQNQDVDVRKAAVLLNTILERKPVVIRRSDGFETRYQRRCGRCDLVIGYHLDGAQFGAEKASGRFDKVIYVLPGSLRTTNAMLNDDE